jgi:hypothetical protein
VWKVSKEWCVDGCRRCEDAKIEEVRGNFTSRFSKAHCGRKAHCALGSPCFPNITLSRIGNPRRLTAQITYI